MTVYELDPLTDARWPALLSYHPRSSIFHTRAWLEALHRTYGYRPLAFTTSNGGVLNNGLVVCEVKSCITGRRLVSLPFSDHCQPLANGDELRAILDYLQSYRRQRWFHHIELRPLDFINGMDPRTGFAQSARFSFQTIDLRPDTDAIYRNFHESCVRRKIKRAERENLRYEAGRSDDLLEKFRRLLLLTRRRHKIPPQPASWFRNLIQYFGDSITVHLVSKADMPVASIVTITHRNSIVYKYGCSDPQFNNVGGTSFLFWKVIQQAKEEGVEEFDLGRSDYKDPGLIAFKEHLGATSSELCYYRNPATRLRSQSETAEPPLFRRVLSRLPDQLFAGAGELFYRHIG